MNKLKMGEEFIIDSTKTEPKVTIGFKISSKNSAWKGKGRNMSITSR